MKIAVVGAGLTGLIGAYRLAQNGHEVSIFEKNNYFGGLASGFKICKSFFIEKTYHHIFTTDNYVIDLINELNLNDKLLWNPSKIGIYVNKKIYPFNNPIDLLNFSPISLISRIRTGLITLFLQNYNNWNNFENITAYEFLLKYYGREAFNVIWEPLLKGKFGDYYKNVSMAWFWARLYVRANSRKFGGELLGYIHGGFQVLIDYLVEKLKQSNVNLNLETNITKITTKNKRVYICTDNKSYEFERVFCTFSNDVFVSFFENQIQNDDQSKYIQKLKSINYIGAICMVFASEQSLSGYYWHNINDFLSFLVFVQHTNLVNKNLYNGLNIYYIGKYLPHDDVFFSYEDSLIIDLWFKDLKKIFNDFDESLVKDVKIFRFKNAQHIVNTNYFNQIPEYKTPFENVYLFNFSQIYPEDRGINYAVREGNKFIDFLD